MRKTTLMAELKIVFLQFTDLSHNYIASDYELMIDICKSEINFLKSSWQNMLGRPLVTILCRSFQLGIYNFVCDLLTARFLFFVFGVE